MDGRLDQAIPEKPGLKRSWRGFYEQPSNSAIKGSCVTVLRQSLHLRSTSGADWLTTEVNGERVPA